MEEREGLSFHPAVLKISLGTPVLGSVCGDRILWTGHVQESCPCCYKMLIFSCSMDGSAPPPPPPAPWLGKGFTQPGVVVLRVSLYRLSTKTLLPFLALHLENVLLP